MQTIIRQESKCGICAMQWSLIESCRTSSAAAVDCCREAVSFFDCVQKLYTFFSGSTACYNLLKDKLEAKKLPVPKQLSDTR